jgi:Tfp pilus assembly protein PilF
MPQKEDRPGLFARMNPFRKGTAGDTGDVTIARSPDSSVRGAQSYPRYTYLNPSIGAPGRRADAVRGMQQGNKSLRSGNTNDALVNYRRAVEADPSYPDAHYSIALVTQQSGEVAASLPLWERLLVLEPDSINTRYNFALALKQANYVYDAAAELQRIIDAKPAESRAHLTLANLYAQQLGDTARARAHYRKLLELDPRNPQAATIRYWLAANP